MTPACKKLRLAQPTLSAQLKQFEEVVGKPLFERKSRQMILNDTGKLVFDYADAIFKKGDEMVQALSDTTSKDVIPVDVGIVAILPRKNVHNFLKIPIIGGNFKLNLRVGNLSELLVLLQNHELDMVISNRAAPAESKGFASVLLERVPLVFVAGPEFKNLRRKFPSSLNGQKLFLPSYQTEIRTQIDQYLKQNNLQPVIKGEIQDMELLRVIAASGDGIVCIPRSAASDLIKAKELYVIGDNIEIYKNFYMITAERQEKHPVVERILQLYQGS